MCRRFLRFFASTLGPTPPADASVDGMVRGAPQPYAPPPEGAPECELAADCPEGTYCDLGECVQSCNVALPCSSAGASCLSRGRCAMSATEASDPPVVDTHVAVVSGPESVSIAGDAMSVTIMLTAAPTDRDIRYRIDPRVSWLRPMEARGTFRGGLAVTLRVDRTGLAVGSHAGTVVFRTTAGDVSVPVELTQSFTGVYQGELRYTTPRALGAIPVRMEVRDRGGSLDMRILADESPTFPRSSGTQATASAPLSGAMVSASFVQAFAAADLGDSPFARPVGRDLQMQVTSTESGGLGGTFTERWVGVFPSAVQVGGTLSLARVPEAEPADFTVGLPGALPANPSAIPPLVPAACHAASAIVAVLGESGSPCNAGSNPTSMRLCGERMMLRSTRFEGAPLVVPGASGESGYDSLSTVCASEVANPTFGTPASSGRSSCFDRGNYECALAYLENAAAAGDSEASRLAQEAVGRRAGVALLLVNDTLVDSFELPFRDDAPGVETRVIGRLDDARSAAAPALTQLYAPHVLEALRSVSPSLARDGDYRGLRRLAQLVARDRLALTERASILVRSRPSERAATRTALHAEALDLLLGLITLSTIEQSQLAPPSPELSLFADSLTELGRRSLQAGERIDPLGLPSYFVPFVYDPTFAAMGATNFQQVLSGYSTDVMRAASDEDAASMALHVHEQSEASLRNELNAVDNEIRGRLRAICGPLAAMPTEPDLEHCGENGIGDLATAQSVYEESIAGVQTAIAQHDGLIARIAIERARVADIAAIRADTIEFVSSSGMRVIAINWEIAAIEAVQTFLSLASNSSLFNGFTGFALGAASAALDVLKVDRTQAQARLQLAQDLRVRSDEARVEVINGMAVVQSMMVGIAEAELTMTQAAIRATTAGIQVATLRSEIEQLRGERSLQESRVTMGLANDPSFRVLRNRAVERAIRSRDTALLGVYLSARAYEFETNTSLAQIDSILVPALRASDVARFADCLPSSYTAFRTAYGAAQSFSDEISLREDVLGIRGPIVDDVTGETLSEAAQFRRALFQPSNLGPDGTVELSFGTNLSRGNNLFSTMVCNDQIRSIQVRLVGDGLGDDTARVYLSQRGTSVMRGCETGRDGSGEVLRTYDLQPRRAELQAGVNVYPMSAPDTQFFGRSVAATEWVIAIPPGSVAPANSDVNPLRIDDIILRVDHSAISLSDSPIRYTSTCGL